MCASNDIKNAKVKLIVDIVQKYINRYDKYLLFSRFYACESRNFDYLGHWQCVPTSLLCESIPSVYRSGGYFFGQMQKNICF